MFEFDLRGSIQRLSLAALRSQVAGTKVIKSLNTRLCRAARSAAAEEKLSPPIYRHFGRENSGKVCVGRTLLSAAVDFKGLQLCV
jgi:hypothetical protein